MNKCIYGGNSRRLCNKKDCITCWEKSLASQERSKFWDYNLNKRLTPRDVFKSGGNKCWFRCEKCDHSFKQKLDVRTTKGISCPYCHSRKLCERQECDYCFNKSFESHEMSKFWCYERNKCSPREFFKGGARKCWLYCDVCFHYVYKSTFSVPDKTIGCPFCGSRELCNDDDCDFCFVRSFASHERSKYWCYEKNKCSPRDILKGTEGKYYFLCPHCNHVYLQALCNISISNRNCHYCTHQKLCDNNECDFCYKNSFASNTYAKYWSVKNKKTARQTFLSSGEKGIFFCDICNLSLHARRILNKISKKIH